MDTETIGAALKRKLGPLPVWAWSVIGGIVLYFLRKRGYLGGMGAAQSGETFQPSQANATPPQAQVPLQPGESVYDPNTGALSTAPGGDSGGDTGAATGVDPSQAIDDLANAIAGGFTTHVSIDRTKPKKTKKSVGKHNKHPSHPGKRTPRKKAGHKQPPHKTTKTGGRQKPGQPRHEGNNTAHKQRPRSSATHRLVNGGRTATKAGQHAAAGHNADRHFGPVPKQPSAPRNRVVKAASQSVVRQRPTTGLTRQTAPVQHPVSSHTPSPHKAAAARTPASPRPSAPPPRAAARTPAPPPARKTSPPPARRRK